MVIQDTSYHQQNWVPLKIEAMTFKTFLTNVKFILLWNRFNKYPRLMSMQECLSTTKKILFVYIHIQNWFMYALVRAFVVHNAFRVLCIVYFVQCNVQCRMVFTLRGRIAYCVTFDSWVRLYKRPIPIQPQFIEKGRQLLLEFRRCD